jgi:hypothetical protein
MKKEGSNNLPYSNSPSRWTWLDETRLISLLELQDRNREYHNNVHSLSGTDEIPEQPADSSDLLAFRYCLLDTGKEAQSAPRNFLSAYNYHYERILNTLEAPKEGFLWIHADDYGCLVKVSSNWLKLFHYFSRY